MRRSIPRKRTATDQAHPHRHYAEIRELLSRRAPSASSSRAQRIFHALAVCGRQDSRRSDRGRRLPRGRCDRRDRRHRRDGDLPRAPRGRLRSTGHLAARERLRAVLPRRDPRSPPRGRSISSADFRLRPDDGAIRARHADRRRDLARRSRRRPRPPRWFRKPSDTAPATASSRTVPTCSGVVGRSRRERVEAHGPHPRQHPVFRVREPRVLRSTAMSTRRDDRARGQHRRHEPRALRARGRGSLRRGSARRGARAAPHEEGSAGDAVQVIAEPADRERLGQPSSSARPSTIGVRTHPVSRLRPRPTPIVGGDRLRTGRGQARDAPRRRRARGGRVRGLPPRRPRARSAGRGRPAAAQRASTAPK